MFWLQFRHALGRVRDADHRFQFEIRQNSAPLTHHSPLAGGREKGGFEFEYVGRGCDRDDNLPS